MIRASKMITSPVPPHPPPPLRHSPSPRQEPKPDAYEPDISIKVENGPKHGGRPKLQRGATQRFNEAMNDAYMQVRSERVVLYGMP